MIPTPRDPDPLPTDLGAPVKPKPLPPAGAQPTETPGIMRKPDGKLETQLPEPAALVRSLGVRKTHEALYGARPDRIILDDPQDDTRGHADVLLSYYLTELAR